MMKLNWRNMEKDLFLKKRLIEHLPKKKRDSMLNSVDKDLMAVNWVYRQVEGN